MYMYVIVAVCVPQMLYTFHVILIMQLQYFTTMCSLQYKKDYAFTHFKLWKFTYRFYRKNLKNEHQS